jgi:hypothetical protein
MVRHDASIARWLHRAVTDAEARGLPELKGLLESLAESTRALRAAELGDSVAFTLRPPLAEGTSATNVSPQPPKSDDRVDPGGPAR